MGLLIHGWFSTAIPSDFDDFWTVGDTPTAKAATNFDKDTQDMKLEKVQKESGRVRLRWCNAGRTINVGSIY